jgi:tRNA-modifying protein YgfZ
VATAHANGKQREANMALDGTSLAMLESMAATGTSTLADEYRALTERCGILDRSERGKLALTGGGAAEFLAGQVTNDVEGLTPGEGCYAAFLTHKGKMLGDLRILRTGQEPSLDTEPTRQEPSLDTEPTRQEPSLDTEPIGQELLLDTERASLQALFDMIRRFKIGYDVELHKRTLECALFSLVGPQADDVARRAADDLTGGASDDDAMRTGTSNPDRDGWLALEEHRHLPVSVAGVPTRLIRTDVGVDVLCESAAAPSVRAALEHAGAEPVGEDAAEILRVEQGRPRYGVDIDDTTIPQEANLNDRAVSFTKGCYVGQETVARLHYKGKPNRLLRGVRLSEPMPPGVELMLGDRVVGRLTSSVVSPERGPIGLTLARIAAEPGAKLSVADSGATALLCELPFGVDAFPRTVFGFSC